VSRGGVGAHGARDASSSLSPAFIGQAAGGSRGPYCVPDIARESPTHLLYAGLLSSAFASRLPRALCLARDSCSVSAPRRSRRDSRLDLDREKSGFTSRHSLASYNTHALDSPYLSSASAVSPAFRLRPPHRALPFSAIRIARAVRSSLPVNSLGSAICPPLRGHHRLSF